MGVGGIAKVWGLFSNILIFREKDVYTTVVSTTPTTHPPISLNTHVYIEHYRVRGVRTWTRKE